MNNAHADNGQDMPITPAGAARIERGPVPTAGPNEPFPIPGVEHRALLQAYAPYATHADRLRERIMAALPNDAPSAAAPGWLRLHRLRAIGTLAAVAAAVALAFTFLFRTGGSNIVLADVAARLRQIKTLAFHQTMLIDDGVKPLVEGEFRLCFSDTLGVRYDYYGPDGRLGMTSYEPPDAARVFVSGIGKTYTRLERRVNAARSTVSEPRQQHLAYLMNFQTGADRRIGRSVVEGVEAEGFEIDASRYGLGGWMGRPAGAAPPTVRVWIDVRTQLPVRYVEDMPGPRPGTRRQMVQNQFVWEADVDPGLFTPPSPEGYTVIELREPELNEESAVRSLRLYAELTGGSYPARIDRSLAAELSAQSRLKFDPGPGGQQKFGQMQYDLDAVWHFSVMLFTSHRNPEYFGERVKPGDAAAVLLRWQEDESRARVIYGNLHAESVATEQ